MLNVHVFEIISYFHKLIFDLWKNHVVFLNDLSENATLADLFIFCPQEVG